MQHTLQPQLSRGSPQSVCRAGRRSSRTCAAASDAAKTVSVAESLSWPTWLRPPAAAAGTEAPPAPALGFERVKSLGQAGIVSYVAVEAAFWAVAAPLAAFLSSTVEGESSQPVLVGGAVVFLNVVRLFTPLKVGAAVLLAPTVERLLSARGSAEDVAELKAALAAAAGKRNGTDRSASQREALSALVERLAAANPTREPAKVDLRNSDWELVYTDSSGNSSGKLGPLTGKVSQVFDGDAGYANVVALGPLEVRLEASYTVKSGKALVVQFESIGVSLAGIRLLSKPFPSPKPRGNWNMLFSDFDTRVILVPETGNVFVLRRV
jgi:PAP_fibrillin